MIKYICDGCFIDIEHEGPNLPPKWASVVAHVHWNSGDESEYEQECTARLMCAKCRGDDQEKLCDRVEIAISRGLNNQPRAAEGKPESRS